MLMHSRPSVYTLTQLLNQYVYTEVSASFNYFLERRFSLLLF